MSEGIREVSETHFRVGSKVFKVRIFDSGDGPEVEFSRVSQGSSMSAMTVSLDQEALEVLGHQFVDASEREFSQDGVESAIFDERGSKLNESFLERLIEEGVVDSDLKKFLKMEKGVGEALGEIFSPDAEEAFEELTNNLPSLSEDISKAVGRDSLEDDVISVFSDMFDQVQETVEPSERERDSKDESSEEKDEFKFSEDDVEDMDRKELEDVVKTIIRNQGDS